MANFQKACGILLSLCLFAVLLWVPVPCFLWGNVFRQLPLYCFLEDSARNIPQTEDPETSELIMENHAAYLRNQVKAENEAGAAPQPASEAQEKLSPVPEAEPVPGESAQGEMAEEQPVSAAKEPRQTPAVTETAETAAAHPLIDLSPEILADPDYLMEQFFILDPNTDASGQALSAAQFLGTDLRIEKDSSVPQILIYHSHSQEAFADSREGNPEDTVVGVGDYLTRLLRKKYGYNVIHVTETFDIIEGEIDRSRAYDYAGEYVARILEENPTVEVVIDLHRDGVPEDRRLVTDVNGRKTAQIMFYNGLSSTVANGPVEYLPNPYIQDNLAFSFQMEYLAARYYPGIYRGIYLAGLRYNLHLRPRAMLLEAGAQTNTVREVKNAMRPVADLLDRVLRGEAGDYS